ncbi:MAG: hypothetical protein BroJett038_01860 [Chloroflexota bacterium]|nr:MAG: hypothetical protein BroJett038_01860 [Chloroflexota bacterium]
MQIPRRICFALLFLAIIGAASVALAAPPNQEATPEAPAAAQPLTEGETCGDCHLDVHTKWATGVHAIAFSRESFQQAWAEQNHAGDCLQCHTTNYEPPTGVYLAENIQCEACHGLTPANHPPEPVEVRTDAGICRDCHAPTFAEFRHSKHAFPAEHEALGCATCHDPHGQTLRLESVDSLCLECHETAPENYIHVTHRSMQTELFALDCASCHMFNIQRDELHELPIHDMLVDTVPCTNCHQQMAQTGQFSILGNVSAAAERTQLRAQVEALEVQLQATAPAAGSAAQVVEGVIIGLLVGIVGVAAIWRGGRRGKNTK